MRKTLLYDHLACQTLQGLAVINLQLLSGVEETDIEVYDRFLFLGACGVLGCFELAAEGALMELVSINMLFVAVVETLPVVDVGRVSSLNEGLSDNTKFPTLLDSLDRATLVFDLGCPFANF